MENAHAALIAAKTDSERFDPNSYLAADKAMPPFRCILCDRPIRIEQMFCAAHDLPVRA